MADQKPDEPSGPSPLIQQELNLNLNLELLREGPDALQVYPGTPIKKVTLCRFQYVQDDIFQEVTTLQSPDLFARAATDPTRASLCPEDASAISANLAFELTDMPEPEEVELLPPHTVKLRATKHASVILAWLAQSVLNASHQLTNLAIILLLASLTVAASLPDDDTDDGPDDDEEHSALCAA